MTGHVVYVRFFHGYTGRFPYPRFLPLSDDTVGPAAEALCMEWVRVPANRKRLQAMRAELYQRSVDDRQERAKKTLLWGQAELATPGRHQRTPEPPRTLEQVLAGIPEPKLTKGAATLEEVAAAEGWAEGWCQPPWPKGDRPHGISHRYPVARFAAKDDAETAAAALQASAAEIAGVAGAKHSWDEVDETLALSNPRFVALAEADLPRHEVMRGQERIDRVRGPAVDEAIPEVLLIQLWLTKIPQPVWQQVLDMEADTREPRATQTPPAAQPPFHSERPASVPPSVIVANPEQLADAFAAKMADLAASLPAQPTTNGDGRKRRAGPKSLSEKNPVMSQVYQALSQACKDLGGPKLALPKLKKDPQFKDLRDQIDGIGKKLDKTLLETAIRYTARLAGRGHNSRPRAH